ncbi:MAG: hypothetical protein M3295_04585 [Chloroflexota bacterium]|nr:hypothetical protein [Chloroflexota bacterium]
MSGRIGEEPGAREPRPEVWDAPWDGRIDRRRPTTAELAVPWLIGIILFLIGTNIVLLALLFTNESRVGSDGSPTPTGSVSGSTGTPTASVADSPTPSGSEPPVGGPITGTPAASAEHGAQFGELEMAFLARADPAAPVALMRDDFSNDDPAASVATAGDGISFHDWAPDGSIGAAVIAGSVVALAPGEDARPLVDNVAQITFGADATTIYGVRVADDGNTETSTIIAIDVESGDEREITSVSYDNPLFGFTGPLDEAQFADDGGAHRLYWLADGFLFLDVFAGPTITIDPADGTQRPVERRPVLSSPDGSQHIEASAGDNGDTTLDLLAADGTVTVTTGVTGAVSHLRWSPNGDRVVFTVGTATPEGGVRQDLYVWTLKSNEAPTALTTSGAAFGAEWLGAPESWRV